MVAWPARLGIGGAMFLALAILMVPALGCGRKTTRKGSPNDFEMVWLSDYRGELSVMVGGKALYWGNQPITMSAAQRHAGQLSLQIGHPLRDLQRDDLPDGTTAWKYRNGTPIEFFFDGKPRRVRMVDHPIEDREFYRYCMKVEPATP